MSAQVYDTNGRQSKRVRLSPDTIDSQSYQCQVCHRAYERIDHLNRHLDSHRNERSFRCEECPAAFNRRDLLLRHQANHAKNAAEGQVGPNRTVERATKACNACVLSKVKCDNCRPCRRCQKKDIVCTTRTSSRSNALPPFDFPEQPQENLIPQPEQHPPAIAPQEKEQSGIVLPENVFDESMHTAQDLLNIYNDTSNEHVQHAIPNFFEQIMVPEPEFLGVDYSQLPPPDLTKWMPEMDWLGNVDIFGNDFAPAIDETFATPNLDADGARVSTTSPEVTTEAAREGNRGESAKRRHAIFRQSPWLWIPERRENAFSTREGITLDERQVDLASSPHNPYASDITIPDRLGQPARDRIFQLVSKTARSQISIPSFPSADCLDKLIKVGIAKRTETDAWIHPYTFDSEVSMPQFLTALVAAGCICFGITSVNRTGLVLQEIVRVSLNTLAEEDNSATRDLQFLQASMLWLDIGAFCGFRRKMEIAESSLQALITALRRAGRFDYVRYPVVAPANEDDTEALDKKWRQWIELESYKRLVYHLWEHDVDMTMVYQRQPLISYAELTLPLPASKLLWLAPSAEAWKTRMLTAKNSDVRPSMRSILQDEGASLNLHQGFDSQIIRSTYLHGLAAQIWEHSQQAVLLQDFSDPSSQLWLRSRQQKLYQCLKHAHIHLENSQAISCLFHEFLQMYLHVDMDIVTRFAGKCGEEAAHRAYISLQPWSLTKEARAAISHAGQVLHAARAIPPYQNRGQDSFLIYHAIMVLWTYSMIINDRARKTGTNTPVAPLPPNSRTQGPIVFLDDPRSSNQSAVDAFVLMNSGTPCLRIISGRSEKEKEKAEICQLKHPSQVLKTGVRLLEGTHPDVDREIGPPLLRALCGLMEELGGLM